MITKTHHDFKHVCLEGRRIILVFKIGSQEMIENRKRGEREREEVFLGLTNCECCVWMDVSLKKRGDHRLGNKRME